MLLCKKVLFYFLIIFISKSSQFTCMDEQGRPVDWYVIYKLPLLEDHENKLIKKGEAYAYITSKTNKGWILSEKSIHSKDSIPGHTLEPFYESYRQRKEDLLHILYSDQPPVNKPNSDEYYTSFDDGHAKGVVLAKRSGGLWLVHSVPRYPPHPDIKSYYYYPPSGHYNGQSFLCITMKPSQLDLAGSALIYNDLYIYSQSVPASLQKQYPNLFNVAIGKRIQAEPWNKIQDIESEAGEKFKVFAKSKQFDKDLYGAWVALDLNVDLFVASWANSHNTLKSTCKCVHSVENVMDVKVHGEGFEVDYSIGKEHSKWAVSSTQEKPWICIGDINRAMRQKVRGGGTVCFENKQVWKAYYDAAAGLEGCPRQQSHVDNQDLCDTTETKEPVEVIDFSKNRNNFRKTQSYREGSPSRNGGGYNSFRSRSGSWTPGSFRSRSASEGSLNSGSFKVE